jgi:2-oxoglutarate dehydrogenase E2 component (dihydrolipoamide succinyltransferase)
MAKEEGIGQAELDQISGSGKEGRVTKKDIVAYLEAGRKATAPVAASQTPAASAAPAAPVSAAPAVAPKPSAPAMKIGEGDEIIEMDRMRKLIADHMVNSVHTSPHVTSFVEADMTKVVLWRNRMKNEFQKKHGEKITFTPIIMEAIVKAIQDFPMINISIEGNNIIKHGRINVGMAAALPSGNLIVPVVKNADQLSLLGLTKAVNDLANRARNNQLKPDEISGGTYTLTNVGTFGNVMGTPIINQPQVAIMAAGAIVKKPAVVETPEGDVIAVRHKMFLSHSYDHRAVDGALGGMFVKRVAEYLESWDLNREI